jgi:hypothetical protein
MKKIILIAVMSVTILPVFAQQDTATRKPQHPNEFGIDATGFLKQFLNLNTSGSGAELYSPTYYLTYRHHFGYANLRIGIGANFDNYNIPAYEPNDLNKYYFVSNSLNAFIGWECFTNLSKHWQVFYGADFRPSLDYYRNDNQYSNGGYATGSETQSQIYGVAPFVGFRFKFSKRLSILTETSYAVNWEQDVNKTYYTPMPGATLPAPTPVNQTTTKFFSSFTAPLSVFIDFTF